MLDTVQAASVRISSQVRPQRALVLGSPFSSICQDELRMHRRTRKSQAVHLRCCLVLWMCSLALGCEQDEPLDEADMMVGGGAGGSEGGATANASDAARSMATNDAG